MLRTTIKDLLARKRRLFTTGIAVLLGVAFMAGTLVLTDTINRTFDSLFTDLYAGIDAHVRAESAATGNLAGGARPRLEPSVVDTVAAVDGVVAAEGVVQGEVRVLDAEGEPVGGGAQGGESVGTSWPVNDAMNPFTLVEGGRPPQAAGEVVMDRSTAEAGGYEVGDTATVVTPTGSHELTVVGTVRFGEVDSPAGATYLLFEPTDALQLLGGAEGFDAVQVVAAEGVTEQEVRDRIAAALPEGAEVLTGTEITDEAQSAVQEGLSFFNGFLLTFALISLFVGSFIIYNTFSILVAQRSREMALLRAIGASRRQVLGSVMLEAAAVGLLASLFGLVTGVAVAALLRWSFGALGIDLPAGGLVIAGRTVVVALAVGVVVTLLSAVIPARRAARVPPIAALRNMAVDRAAGSFKRAAAGVVVTAIGGGLIALGLVGDIEQALASVGVGALLTFVGIAVLGPVLARPAARLIGAPLTWFSGMSGRLARENAMRNPKRTASTASALMIGVALVGFITILASSTRASIDQLVDDTFTGDYIIDGRAAGDLRGIDPSVAEQLSELPQVEAATGVQVAEAQVAGQPSLVIGLDVEAASRILDIAVVDGSATDLEPTEIAVSERIADINDWSSGDTVEVVADQGRSQLTLTIGAVYETNELLGDYLLDRSGFEANLPPTSDVQVFVEVGDGVDPADARPEIEAVLADHPNANLQDLTEFKKTQTDQVNQILNLIYILLALAVLIALIGIANTLALSILERTRELGLLRAVGMTKKQIRSTVRLESVIIALFGTFMGLIIAVFFGWAMFLTFREQGFTQFSVAPRQLAVVAVLAGLAGVVAAIGPARRAARLDVLDAISST